MSSPKICYFDNNATTRVAPEVVEAMLPFLNEFWGNPSSVHRFGRQVADHLETARAKVAALIHADPAEVIFTSCGTESNNSAIHSALATQPAKRHVIVTAVEHPATLRFGDYLAKKGCEVSQVTVGSDGSLDLERLERAIRPDTAVVSVMWANNETGVVFPIAEIAAICGANGTLFHTDAVQAAGKVPIDVRAAGPDLLSLSAHKLHGPKGVGMLYARRGARFQPYLIGGGQESGRRSGTENVASIVGFGRAAELALTRLEDESTRVRELRDRLENGILASIPDTSRNGAQEPRLPNTSNIAFEGLEADALLIALDQVGICASSGSACKSGSLEPSHVLRAMGLSAAKARGSIRFSLGVYNSAEEVEYLLRELPPAVKRLRALNSLSDPSTGPG